MTFNVIAEVGSGWGLTNLESIIPFLENIKSSNIFLDQIEKRPSYTACWDIKTVQLCFFYTNLKWAMQFHAQIITKPIHANAIIYIMQYILSIMGSTKSKEVKDIKLQPIYLFSGIILAIIDNSKQLLTNYFLEQINQGCNIWYKILKLSNLRCIYHIYAYCITFSSYI